MSRRLLETRHRSMIRLLSRVRLSSTFASLGVGEFWLPRLAALGASSPTAVQVAALPLLLGGRGAVLRAETGSGKTLAYLLPALEALRTRLAALEEGTQLLPVALIIVPTEELAAQVVRVAAALFPEGATMVRAAHGLLGVPRRANAGIVVATPRGASEGIHAIHRSALRLVVVDEADALLRGESLGLLRAALFQPLKLLEPAQRPAHVFSAATLPRVGGSGKNALSFLDRFYSPEDCVRVVTPGAHAIGARVRQAFWQVDAGLPLTKGEKRVALERSAVRAANAAAREAEAAAVAGKEEEGEGEGEGEGDDENETENETEKEIDDYESEGEADDIDAAVSPPDAVRASMAHRSAEDVLLGELADDLKYRERLAKLTRAAVMDALLLPARRAGLWPEPADVAGRLVGGGGGPWGRHPS